MIINPVDCIRVYTTNGLVLIIISISATYFKDINDDNDDDKIIYITTSIDTIIIDTKNDQTNEIIPIITNVIIIIRINTIM